MKYSSRKPISVLCRTVQQLSEQSSILLVSLSLETSFLKVPNKFYKTWRRERLGFWPLALVHLTSLVAFAGCGHPMPDDSAEDEASANPTHSAAILGHATDLVESRNGTTSEAVAEDSPWPDAWFQTPKTASEVGLVNFTQSPILDEPQASGEIPPVVERLPDDPPIMTPLGSPGSYGGRATVFESDRPLMNPPETVLRMGPAVRKTLPNLAESVALGDGGRSVTITLRSGVKWSDGHLLTSEDFVFWFEHIERNPELTPVVGPTFDGATIERHDARRFSYRFPEPRPLFVNQLAHSSSSWYVPAHFLKNFHPSFTDPVALDREARRRGFQDWVGLFTAANSVRDQMVFFRPVMTPFVLVSKTSTRGEYRRNPYYFKIDPEGRQLPYIDSMTTLRVTRDEIATARASTGQVTIAGQQMQTADIPLFKNFEKENGFRTLIWRRVFGSDVVIQPNHTHPDPAKRSVLSDARFRRALSLAIDRAEINEIVYFGHATPRQLTVVPWSEYYEPKFAEAFAEYDPERARRLLDQAGIVDRDGDGRREGKDGKPLVLTLEYLPFETPKQIVIELVTAHWREVGIDVGLRQINASLQGVRARSGLMDLTVWHADRTSDILFPVEPFWFVPMRAGWEQCQWGKWARWNLSGGTVGWEPPREVASLYEWWQQLQATPDVNQRIELGRRILASQAEHLWAIGTVGLAPQPFLISDRLRNVPDEGFWGWDSRWTMPYYTETWYFTDTN